MPEPDCFLRYRMYALLRGILRRENPGAPLQRAVVLKWFYLLSHGNTFVGWLLRILLQMRATSAKLLVVQVCEEEKVG